MTTLKYFAYGSNLLLSRLKERVLSAQFYAVAALKGHVLKFHKPSKRDGSAKCDAFYTGNPDDVVYGVVFEMDEGEKSVLDDAESLGVGYLEKNANVVSLTDQEEIEVFLYCAILISDGPLAPYDWYKAFVVEGAKEHDLPEGYIAMLETIEAEEDEDKPRAAMNRGILERNR